MTLTQQQWLKRPGLFRCILVEADYLEAGQLKTLYLSNYAFRSLPTDSNPNQVYKNWLNKRARLSFAQRMAVALYGKNETSTSAIEFFLHPSIEHLILDADFASQQIRVFIGDPKWPRDMFIEKFVGIADKLDPVRGNLARLNFSDKSQALQKSALTNVITSSTNEAEFKPRLLGKCFNIEPKLIDEVNNVYQLNDGAFKACTAVRESGYLIENIPANYTVDLATGLVTVHKNVSGRITMDAQGHVEAGQYLSTAEQMINYLLGLLGMPAAFDSNVLPAYELGLYIREPQNVDDLIDMICESVGGNWFYDALGQFRLQHYTGLGVATDTIGRGKIKKRSLNLVERLPAVKQLSLGYQRNWTEQKDGLAAAVTENTPELATLYSKTESVVTGSNVVANEAAAIEQKISSLIANKSDAEIELARRLALTATPRKIFECESTIKKHEQGETKTLTYSQFFKDGKDVLICGHVHKINNPADVVEFIA